MCKMHEFTWISVKTKIACNLDYAHRFLTDGAVPQWVQAEQIVKAKTVLPVSGITRLRIGFDILTKYFNLFRLLCRSALNFFYLDRRTDLMVV